MRILFTIAHLYDSQTPEAGTPHHGSLGGNRTVRGTALSACIASLHQVFGRSQCIMEHSSRTTRPVNQMLTGDFDIVVCTTQGKHLLRDLPLPATAYKHESTKAEPSLLGFECQRVMYERLGHYDYYCYLEDDLVVHDPLFFVKLAWFNNEMGDDKLLQPNRYEVARGGFVDKAYLDGDLDEESTARFQNVHDQPVLESSLLQQKIAFHRALNPHSGCYFLNQQQMQFWASQPHFLDCDTSFIDSLASAATLGIMRTFKVYKPARENAAFLEIQHAGNTYLSLLRRG